MKKSCFYILAVTVFFILSGCVPINYDITDRSQPVIVDSDGEYIKVKINERVYVPFGTLNGNVDGRNIGECIAYNKNDSNERYYSIMGTDDFIAEYYVDNIMSQMFFLRAEDTIGKDIEVPAFINDQGYDFRED